MAAMELPLQPFNAFTSLGRPQLGGPHLGGLHLGGPQLGLSEPDLGRPPIAFWATNTLMYQFVAQWASLGDRHSGRQITIDDDGRAKPRCRFGSK